MAGTISKRKGHPIRLATWPIEFQNICQYQLMCETLKPRNQWIVILRVITSHSQPILLVSCTRAGPACSTQDMSKTWASFRNGVASASDASMSSLL